ATAVLVANSWLPLTASRLSVAKRPAFTPLSTRSPSRPAMLTVPPPVDAVPLAMAEALPAKG
ncbi:MAG: hypothetical protein RR831_17745, partial [Stenotrophomonas sp.]